MTKQQPRAQASPRLQELRERERAFLERAQRGENIRDEAILFLQPIIQRMAYRMYARYSPQSHALKAVERADLEQEAYERMLMFFPKALEQKEPFRWLTGTAHGAMRDQLNGHGDAIKRHHREKPIPLLRLDRPLTNDGATLADILPERLYSAHHLPQHIQVAIERAIATLPEKQRIVIERRFGFHGLPVPFSQICYDLHPNRRGKPSTTYLYNRALAALRQTLSDTVLQQTKEAGGTRS